MRTTEKLPVGLRNIGYRLDPALWPDGSSCVMTIEVSHDGGKTWRVNSASLPALKESTLQGGVFGLSLILKGQNGNENPEFMVRCRAQFDGIADVDMATSVEVIDDVLLIKDRLR